MRIETERLVLKPFEEKDDTSLAALLMNGQIRKTYMVPDFESEAQYLALAGKFRELSHCDSRFVAGVYLGERLVGFLNDVGIENGSVELGYVIDPAYQNRGCATEALRGAIGYLFRMGFREVTAGAFESNHASLRVMAGAGMNRQEKTDEIEYRGEVHRCVYYSIRKPELV